MAQGFGVCEYTNKADAQDAIEQLDNSNLQGSCYPQNACRSKHAKEYVISIVVAHWHGFVCYTGRQIGLRADRDIDGQSSRDDRSGRRDTDYRSRRDESYRSSRDDGRSERRDRSPGRGDRDRGHDRHRRDYDHRDDRRDDREPRRRESRGGKSAEELDAEMDMLKQQVCCYHA